MGGKSSTISTSEQRILSLQIQQSSYGLALPIVFGQNRIAGNLIDYTDFTAVATTTRTTQGGKGGGGVTQEDTKYTYEAAVIMGLCHGPIAGIPSWWRDKERRYDLGELGLTLMTGQHEQQPWAWMQGKHPERALGYSDTAYVCSPNYSLGSNAQVPNHMFEVAGLMQIGTAGVVDADPGQILPALLTHASYGAGFPASRLWDTATYGAYCRAAGIVLSPVLQEQQEAREHINLLLQQTNSAAVWSGGKLKIIPYGDEALTGGGASYTPNLTPVYDLTDDDYLVSGAEDPITVERKSIADAYNQVTIEYLDRANSYNIATATAKDQQAIEKYGLRPADPVKMHGICVGQVAQTVAQIELQRALYIRNLYKFRLGWRYCLLEPMDLVTLTDSGLGFVKLPVRIIEIEESSDGDLSITAEDYPFGVASATAHPGQPSMGSGINFNAAPGSAYAPTMFEAPLQLTGNDPQIWLATAGGADWGGCSVWVSLDGDSYRKVGQMAGKSRYGTTTSALDAGPAIDSAQTLAVDISAAGGQLLGGTHADAEAMVTACYVGGEYISYADATLTGPGTYQLGYLVRGGYGSLNEAHPAGSQFVRLTDPLFKYSFPRDWLGKTIRVKLTSYNVFGGAEQSLADVPAYAYTIVGAPLGAVQNLALTTTWAMGRDACIKWDKLDGADSYDVEVWAGTTSARVRLAQAVVDNQFVYTPQDMRSDGGPWRSVVFRVRGRAVTGKTGPWSQIVASNPQVATLQGIKIESGIKSGFFSCASPVEDDFAGIIIWLSTDPACSPVPANQVYEGQDTFVTLSHLSDGTPLAGGTTYYLRAAGYDTFGMNSLNVSTSMAFEVYSLVPDANSVGLTQFASGIEPVSIVTDATLPTAKITSAIMWQGKLYRWNGSAYVSSVAAGDVTGQITSTQIADDAITAPKIAANAVTASEIAADAVVAGKIAAGAVNAREIATDAVTADKIAANSVTSQHILANSITGDKLVGNTITGDKIQAGTLTANLLQSGTGGGNLIPNAAFAATYVGADGYRKPDAWAEENFPTPGTWSAVSYQPDYKPEGVEYLAIYRPNGGTAGAYKRTQKISVVGGEWYELSGWTCAINCTWWLYAIFFDANGNWLGTVPYIPVSGGGLSKSLNSYQRVFGVGQAPAGAVSAQISIEMGAPTGASYEMAFLLQPYFGVANGPNQSQPSPWSPSGLGTQIHGGVLKTNTVTADRLTVNSLSAISGNMGYLTAGEVHGGSFHSGGFSSAYAWPPAGQRGFHLGPDGLRMGNANDGHWVQIDASGQYFTMPGLRMENGTLYIDQLNVIGAHNIKPNSVATAGRVTGSSDSLSVTITAARPGVLIFYIKVYNKSGTNDDLVGLSINGYSKYTSNKQMVQWDRHEIIAIVDVPAGVLTCQAFANKPTGSLQRKYIEELSAAWVIT